MPFNPDTPRSRDEVLLQAIVSGDSSMMGDPRDREEEFVKAIADKETLPDYSEASNGDVLQIGADGPEWGSVSNELPAIAAGDAGKVLKVNAGETGTEWGEAGGASLYHHNITLKITSSSHDYYARFEVISSLSSGYTKEVLWAYMHSNIQGNMSAEIHPNTVYYDNGPYYIDQLWFGVNTNAIRFTVVSLTDGSNSGWKDSTNWSVVNDYRFKIE